MSKSKSMTIEIPAELMEETVKDLRQMERFSGMTDAEIVEAVLNAGVNKALPTMEDCTANVEKCYSVLLAVCTAIQAGAAVDALMPALWDVEWRLGDVVQNMDKAQQ